MKFKTVLSQTDFPAVERDLLKHWYKEGILEKYLNRNHNSEKKFSFLDGPITANNPMGVHHAWGRTYKDLWQRFYNMKGYEERFQNGFDEQGLWVEVEVEKELGLKSKKDIENIVPGDKFASLEKFVNLCKERVKKYSQIQTEQSKRLGYFMDWENSYHTSSDKNNYTIWNFLKTVWQKGWLYKGHDSVPWCPRCGTAISQHEILTEEYKLLTHTSVFFKLPLKNKKLSYLLVWTTTPWTIPANVAVAVDPDMEYSEVATDGETYFVASSKAKELFPEGEVISTYTGINMSGWEYTAPFDDLSEVKKELGDYQHRVVATDKLILPISAEEGTGLVHIAPGCGAEDFALGKKEDLPIVAVIDEAGIYLKGFADLSGLTTKQASAKVVENLQDKGFIWKTLDFTHRYPTCWRCKTELIWRVVDEWYIAMDFTDEKGKTYREQMKEVAKKINWLPEWGKDRELDWLKNMHDWLISKKRYWGLALPIWVCNKCKGFQVIGSQEELHEKSVQGWSEFAGHSPHKPWIDQVKIKCSSCDGVASRIPDVGNPWLDAGIVPFSTMPQEWFPANFITESFPGQFKNWFYSLIAMSTALKNTPPMETILGYATVRDEIGEEMHKSKGNSIEFNEAADKIGVDVMRWMYVTQNPENNLNFGFKIADEVRRRFYLIFWNSYKYFVDYANLIDWDCSKTPQDISQKLTILDKWILARLNQLVILVNSALEKYDASTASRSIEEFIVNDLSTWYIRRSRDRVGPSAPTEDENIFLSTLYGTLVTLAKLIAPFMPFIAEEIYLNLTNEKSVHLADYPLGDKSLLNQELVKAMITVRQLAEIGLALRKTADIKLRQPLQKFTYSAPQKLDQDLEKILSEELNVKKIEYIKQKEITGELDAKITPSLAAEGETRELIRRVQQLRKEQNLTLNDKVKIYSPAIPKTEELKTLLKKQTNALEVLPADKTQAVSIEVVS